MRHFIAVVLINVVCVSLACGQSTKLHQSDQSLLVGLRALEDKQYIVGAKLLAASISLHPKGKLLSHLRVDKRLTDSERKELALRCYLFSRVCTCTSYKTVTLPVDKEAGLLYAAFASNLIGQPTTPLKDAMAAGYAQQGKYDKAVKLQQAAYELLTSTEGQKLRRDYASRLHCYENRRPWSVDGPGPWGVQPLLPSITVDGTDYTWTANGQYARFISDLRWHVDDPFVVELQHDSGQVKYRKNQLSSETRKKFEHIIAPVRLSAEDARFYCEELGDLFHRWLTVVLSERDGSASIISSIRDNASLNPGVDAMMICAKHGMVDFCTPE